MKTVGENRASVRIFHSGQAGDLGHDTFEKKKMSVTFSGIRPSQIRFGPTNWVGQKRGAIEASKFSLVAPVSIISTSLRFPPE